MNRLLKLALIPLLVGLAAAAQNQRPTNYAMTYAADGSVKITRNGKTITCEQLMASFRAGGASRRGRRPKWLDCNHIMHPLDAH